MENIFSREIYVNVLHDNNIQIQREITLLRVVVLRFRLVGKDAFLNKQQSYIIDCKNVFLSLCKR